MNDINEVLWIGKVVRVMSEHGYDLSAGDAISIVKELKAFLQNKECEVVYEDDTEEEEYPILSVDDLCLGMTVRYNRPNGGYQLDIDHAKAHLKLNETYIVSDYEIHSSSTDVFLEGFDERNRFNSCLFSVVNTNDSN